MDDDDRTRLAESRIARGDDGELPIETIADAFGNRSRRPRSVRPRDVGWLRRKLLQRLYHRGVVCERKASGARDPSEEDDDPTRHG